MDDFLTVNQTAIALKVHPLTVRRYIKEGKLKAYKAGGNIRVSINDLRLFTQSYVPHHQAKPVKFSPNIQAKEFSSYDPILSLKGKGMSMSKIEQE